ncbi:MAG: glycosyltransferase family 39 protein [Lentisphaerae bacterium]|nr:glycosyltransferase family 39 protein [Lentisphaerota bacterium]
MPRRDQPAVVRDVLVLAAAWCVGILLVNPAGNFPLNDDWSYGLAVQRLVAGGDFRPTGWTSMPLISQAAWGALFCLPGGFSFHALRASTLTLGFVGMLAAYLLMRELRQPRRMAMVVALTLGFNPIYFALSHTFMTDIPFTASALLALWLFTRHLRTNDMASWLLATALALLATLCRQLGLAIPLAFAFALLVRRGLMPRDLWRGVAPVAICAVAFAGFQHWLKGTGRWTALMDIHTQALMMATRDPGALFRQARIQLGICLLDLGWFLAPALLYLLARSAPRVLTRGGWGRGAWIATGGGALAAAVGLGVAGLRLPLGGNVLIDSGIGPLTLRDTYVLGLDSVPGLSVIYWQAVTALGLLGAALLLMAIGWAAWRAWPRLRARGWRCTARQAATVLFLAAAAVYLAPLLVEGFCDRYMLPLLVPLLGVAAFGWPPARGVGSRVCRWAGVLLLGGQMVASVGGAHDYLAWNRARWAALEHLTEKVRVSPEEIDGGFEFNGLHGYDPAYERSPERSWWWVKRATYVIAFAPVPGYATLKVYPYRNWLPWREGRVLILRQLNEP